MILPSLFSAKKYLKLVLWSCSYTQNEKWVSRDLHWTSCFESLIYFKSLVYCFYEWVCIKKYECVFVQSFSHSSACVHENCMQRCVGSFSIYKCVSACAYICVCACSCPRCALLISYQGSLFAGWQVAISPLIQGLFVRWELHWEHMTKHFTSASFPHFFSLSLWIVPDLFSATLPPDVTSPFPTPRFFASTSPLSLLLPSFFIFSPFIISPPLLLLLYLFFLPWTTSSSALGVKKGGLYN